VPARFSIWIVSPPGYAHSRCFEELALSLREAFAALGLNAPVVTNPAQIEGSAVVLGANLLPALEAALPSRLILYNLEQIENDSPWLNPAYVELLKRYPVWDYSARNIERLKTFGVKHALLCGIGYMPALTRIPAATEDIDVLFVGSLNARRRLVLEQIAQQGKNVQAHYTIYGEERDAVIARSKIVLNLHFYAAQVFEIVRVSYLMANRKCVVSEIGQDEALEAPLREGIAFAPYDRLAETCVRLLSEPQERARLAQRGFTSFSALSQVPMLKRALEAFIGGA
jgi:hypothetical protein